MQEALDALRLLSSGYGQQHSPNYDEGTWTKKDEAATRVGSDATCLSVTPDGGKACSTASGAGGEACAAAAEDDDGKAADRNKATATATCTPTDASTAIQGQGTTTPTHKSMDNQIAAGAGAGALETESAAVLRQWGLAMLQLPLAVANGWQQFGSEQVNVGAEPQEARMLASVCPPAEAVHPVGGVFAHYLGGGLQDSAAAAPGAQGMSLMDTLMLANACGLGNGLNLFNTMGVHPHLAQLAMLAQLSGAPGLHKNIKPSECADEDAEGSGMAKGKGCEMEEAEGKTGGKEVSRDGSQEADGDEMDGKETERTGAEVGNTEAIAPLVGCAGT